MTENLNEKEWLKEFNEFMESSPATPPPPVSKNILARTKRWVNPSPQTVFLKLLVIHSVMGTFSLGLCNQFGLNPFNTRLSLSEYFMTFGHSVCMTLCGVLFVSLSVLAASVLLSRDEFNVFRQHVLLQLFSLSLLSLATFVAFGAKISLGIGLLWLAGAVAGGALPTLVLSQRRFQTI